MAKSQKFQVDDDNSGAIDFDEFLSMMGNRQVLDFIIHN